MSVKITLITPPDIFQNERESILLIDLPNEEQDSFSKWLGEYDQELSLNIYFYQGETELSWFFHALSCATYVYMNLNNMSIISSYLIGYILSKPKTYFKVDNKNIAEVYKFINNNKVNDVNEFLERIFSGKR